MIIENILRRIETAINRKNREKEIVFSMPVVNVDSTYFPPWAMTDEKNVKYLSELFQGNSKRIGTILHRENKESLFLWVNKISPKETFYFIPAFNPKDGIDVEKIQYAAKVKHFKLEGKFDSNAVGEVSIWRDKKFDQTSGIHKVIFTRFLFPQYKSVITDAAVYEDNVEFWERRVKEFIAKGFYVYALKIDEYDSSTFNLEVLSFTRLFDASEIIVGSKYYGKNLDNMVYRILITDKLLEE